MPLVSSRQKRMQGQQPQPANPANQHRRLLIVLEHLLALPVGDLSAAMTEACQLIADVLGADKVDVFFHVPSEQALVAEGTSDTEMGRAEKARGLDHIPLAKGGRVVQVFQTGQSYWSEHAEQDAVELPEVVSELGVRSTLTAPLEVAGIRRGVLLVSSARPAAFTRADLEFVEAVARWVGLTSTRLAHAEYLAAQAAEQGIREGANQLRLTARQIEVAALVRLGLSNTEIAERLVLEPGTVANHINGILRRLGFRSRTQVAVWAAEHQLRTERTDPQQPR